MDLLVPRWRSSELVGSIGKCYLDVSVRDVRDDLSRRDLGDELIWD